MKIDNVKLRKYLHFRYRTWNSKILYLLKPLPDRLIIVLINNPKGLACLAKLISTSSTVGKAQIIQKYTY